VLGGELNAYPIDIAPELVPLLHRCEIQIIGACSLAEYRTVERDAAIASCLEPVWLPSATSALF
jgi:ATP-dependent Clp protease ATP-binding subunit ClpA